MNKTKSDSFIQKESFKDNEEKFKLKQVLKDEKKLKETEKSDIISINLKNQRFEEDFRIESSFNDSFHEDFKSVFLMKYA